MIALPSELSLRNLEALCVELGAARPAGGPIVLDGTAVERVDTASLQALCALAGSGATLSWHAASPPLVAAAQMLGLSRLLGLGEVT